jgi:transposase-like protein
MAGKTTRLGLHKCYVCQKPFTVRQGTIFESSHLPLRLWLQVIHLMAASKKGVSTRQIQRMLMCSMKTAWFLNMRIREAMRTKTRGIFTPQLGGPGAAVEGDETYIGPKKRNLSLSKRKALGDEWPVKQSVFSLVERDGAVRSFHVANVRADTLRPILARHVASESHFITDEASAFNYPGYRFASHQTVNHSANEYVRGDVYTNTVEGYFSILKRGIYGVYQHVSEAHLQRYLVEFDFRYSNREKLGVDDIARAAMIVRGAKGKRLTYETTAQG